jgi:hypothetical protein
MGGKEIYESYYLRGGRDVVDFGGSELNKCNVENWCVQCIIYSEAMS